MDLAHFGCLISIFHHGVRKRHPEERSKLPRVETARLVEHCHVLRVELLKHVLAAGLGHVQEGDGPQLQSYLQRVDQSFRCHI